MAIFYLGFAFPGALALALAGALATLLAGPHVDAPAMAARTMRAVLGLVFAKSLVVNVLIAMRYHVMLIGVYLVLLTGALLAILIVRGFLGGVMAVSNGMIATLFLMASLGCSLAVVRDLDL